MKNPCQDNKLMNSNNNNNNCPVITRRLQEKKKKTANMFSQLSSTFASLFFFWTVSNKYFPYHLRITIERYLEKFVTFFYPYVQISFHEFSSDITRNYGYTCIEHYLSSKSTAHAKNLKAEAVKNSHSITLSLEDYEEVFDEFQGVNFFWCKVKTTTETKAVSFYPARSERRHYKLTFHRRYREFVTGLYLKHVLDEGKAIGDRNRQLKLYTNSSGEGSYGFKAATWSHIAFEHPASFETLAMDPNKKKEIMDDLLTFSAAKDYYERIGKAWKRGYLLYGPPGTGKSTMIAAIANFLNYDVYDLELTAVKSNTDLRKLLIDTSSKSIIVIEDLDCSLDLTGKRKKKKDENGETSDPVKKEDEQEKEEKNQKSKVTLSGLLNFIDGIWSSSGGERIIIFTTNYVEKLDQALIRRGRMDKHIELTYCDFEGFKVLARNYLGLESHSLFDPIRRLLEETKMTPADVAENLMPKSFKGDAADSCLGWLIQALEAAKEKEREEENEGKRLKKTEEGLES